MIKKTVKPQSSQCISDIVRRKITYRIIFVFLLLSVFFISTLLSIYPNLWLLLATVLVFILTSIIIYPLYKKVPQDVMIDPILYLLEMTRFKKRMTQDEYFDRLPIEIRDTFYNIEELIKEVEISTKQVATYRFATRVAHDIRSPLAVLNSVVEQYKQSGKLDVETVTSVCRRISKIANDLIVQHNPSDKHQSVVLPYLVLKEVVNEKYYLAEQFSCQLSLSVSDEAKSVFCQASALELSRVLSNLINNAMEAMKGSGHVVMDLRCEESVIVLSVQDNGAGMSERTKADILSGQVVSTKSRGTGIGLRSAIEYIQSVTGDLSIHTQLGQGTTIVMRLPICPSPPWFLGTLLLDDNDSILVVDDESDIYGHWQEKLKKASVNMHYISGGEKSVRAFDYIRDSRYDLYFLDYQNPLLTRDGIEMIQEYGLKDKAILVTSNYDDALLQKICITEHIKMLPKGFIQDLSVLVLNKAADIYLIEDDNLFIKSFCRHVDLQAKTIQVFSDLFNVKRCLPLLNKAATFYVDLNIETDRDGFHVATLLSEQGIDGIYILSGEEGLDKAEIPKGVKAVYNKANVDWSMAL